MISVRRMSRACEVLCLARALSAGWRRMPGGLWAPPDRDDPASLHPPEDVAFLFAVPLVGMPATVLEGMRAARPATIVEVSPRAALVTVELDEGGRRVYRQHGEGHYVHGTPGHPRRAQAPSRLLVGIAQRKNQV